MAKNSTKTSRKKRQFFSKSDMDTPLSLDQSQHEVQSADIEKTTF